MITNNTPGAYVMHDHLVEHRHADGARNLCAGRRGAQCQRDDNQEGKDESK